jgi:mannitol-1-/sugar-/sorbitol-6-/2-deoxyglucose-6-phosphatase
LETRVRRQTLDDPRDDRVDVIRLQSPDGRHGTTLRGVCQSCRVTIAATLFDMDGLLIDSEVLWHKAEVEIFGSLGVPLLASASRSTKGVFVDQVVDDWYARYPWSGPSNDVVVDMLLERVGALVESEGRLLPGALRAIDLANARGPVALASSTPLALIHRCLEHFGLAGRFASLHSAEFEPYGKPHPGVFLTAASSLGVAPTSCLVLEDSSAGVIAARAASMRVVAVPAPEDRGAVEFLLADLVLDTLEDLSDEWLDEQFA